VPLTANPISEWPVNGDGVDTFGLEDMSSVSPSGYVAGHIGQALIYDGINDKSVVPHNAAYNFGDASADSPFSIFAWVDMDDATGFNIISKFSSGSSAEFFFRVDAADKLRINSYDGVSTVSIGKQSTITLTSDQGSYVLVGFTYDGSSTSAGYKLYLGNGSGMTRLATVDNQAGSYTAMHATTSDIEIGALSALSSWADGDIDVLNIFDYALSDGGVAEGVAVGAGSDIDFLWNGGTGRELTVGNGIVFPSIIVPKPVTIPTITPPSIPGGAEDNTWTTS
jgi:hypothetical protein